MTAGYQRVETSMSTLHGHRNRRRRLELCGGARIVRVPAAVMASTGRESRVRIRHPRVWTGQPVPVGSVAVCASKRIAGPQRWRSSGWKRYRVAAGDGCAHDSPPNPLIIPVRGLGVCVWRDEC